MWAHEQMVIITNEWFCVSYDLQFESEARGCRSLLRRTFSKHKTMSSAEQHIINQQTHQDATTASTQDQNIPQTHAPNKATISRMVLIG